MKLLLLPLLATYAAIAVVILDSSVTSQLYDVM